MNIPEKLSNAVWTAAIILTVFLAILSIKELKSIGYVGKSDQILNTITVNGTGDAVAVPDVATFSFTVSETGKTVSSAQEQATAKINDALKTVRDGGVAEKDIKTVSYSINPHYEYSGGACAVNYCPPSKSVLTGYDVSQSVEVKIRDLSKAGALFSSIGSLGIGNINGLNFSVDEPDSVKALARAEAIAKAEVKAKELAKQLNVRLVRITSFYDSGDEPRPYGYGMGGDVMAVKTASAPMAPTPEVPTGEQKVISNVSITYEIE